MYSCLAICLTLGFLFVGSLAAADDPFVGKWKFNSAHSKVTGWTQVVEDLGGHKYKVSVGNDSWTILVDGSDQPWKHGGTMSWKDTGPGTMMSVHKVEGKTSSVTTWKLSDDGKLLTNTTNGTNPDGSSYTSDFRAKRVGGKAGWAGTWESTEQKVDSYPEWDIDPYERDGLSFTIPSSKEKQDMKFDGKYYPDNGPEVPAGSTSSAKRINNRTIEWTDKLKDEVMDHQELKVSENGKMLTLFIKYPGEKTPQTVVYDRQ